MTALLQLVQWEFWSHFISRPPTIVLAPAEPPDSKRKIQCCAKWRWTQRRLQLCDAFKNLHWVSRYQIRLYKCIFLGKKSGIQETDEKRAGCGILAKKGREYGIRTPPSRPWAKVKLCRYHVHPIWSSFVCSCCLKKMGVPVDDCRLICGGICLITANLCHLL